MKSQEGDRERPGMTAVMWMPHSERPLRVDKIWHALKVETGSTDLNPNNGPPTWTELSRCQVLAAVNEGSSTIRLIHFTVKEHLSVNAGFF